MAADQIVILEVQRVIVRVYLQGLFVLKLILTLDAFLVLAQELRQLAVVVCELFILRLQLFNPFLVSLTRRHILLYPRLVLVIDLGFRTRRFLRHGALRSLLQSLFYYLGVTLSALFADTVRGVSSVYVLKDELDVRVSVIW